MLNLIKEGVPSLLAPPSHKRQLEGASWAVRAGGLSNDYGRGIAVDASGDALVTGFFQGMATFGSTSLVSNGSSDVFVGKVSSGGVWEWAVRAGGSSNDFGYGDIAVDASGGTLVTGFFQDTAMFGSTSLVSSGSSDVFVGKVSSGGVWEWAVRAGGSSSDYGDSIAVDASGGALVTGYFQGTAIFGNTSLVSSGNNDVFVGKVGSGGVWEWAVRAGSSLDDDGNGIAVDASGDALVTGNFEGTAMFGSTSLVSSGSYDVFVGKVGSGGVWEWAVRAGSSLDDFGYGIAVDASGGALVTGNFHRTATFGSTSLVSSGSYDVFVVKVSSSGVWEWAVRAGGSSNDFAYGIAVDASGGALVTGNFEGTATFGSTSLVSSGGYDVFVGKVSNGGVWEWAVWAGGSSSDFGYGIAVDASGGALATGNFQGTAMFGSTSLVSSGNNDVFVWRLPVPMPTPLASPPPSTGPPPLSLPSPCLPFPTSPIPAAPTPFSPSHPPPYSPPPLPSLPSPPSSPPPPSCSSPTGRTYTYPCCANPSSSYGGMWVNARWIGEPWFAYACSCIIPQGTLIPVGSASVDYCCYLGCS